MPPPIHVRKSQKTILGLFDMDSPMSGVYKDAGYRVIRFDELRGQDVRLIEKPPFPVYGIVAHPPCTHLAGSGARWWASKGTSALLDGLSTADAVIRLAWVCRDSLKFWVLENPVGRLTRFLGAPKFTFQPHEFGGWLDPIADEYTKRTCLWGNFNIPIKKPVPPRLGSIMHMKMSGSDGPDCGERNAFPLGFSRAFFDVNP